jgi:3-deoxy-D-manno-octulosonic acid kinase
MKEGSDKLDVVERRTADGRVTLLAPAARLDAVLAAGLLSERELAACDGAKVTGLGGRGAPVALPVGGERAIAKALGRGGLAGRLLRAGFSSPRRLRELVAVQLEIERRGVAVAPFAFARIRRDGASGRHVLEFATIEQQGARDAAALLADAALPATERRALLHAAGAVVRSLHAAGVVHADLNAKNLLLARSPPRAWLIDFDRSRAGPPLPPLQREALGNVARLLRSAEKLRLLGAAVGARELLAFAHGYLAAAAREAGGAPRRRAWWDAVGADWRRSIAFHRLGWRLFGRGAAPRA